MENKGSPTTQSRPTNRRLVLFPLPFQGHINPMLQLANILHTKGFKITIVHTQFNSPNQSNFPHFTFKSIPDGLSESHLSNVNLDTSNFIINFINKSCVDVFKSSLATLLDEEPEGSTVACLISDALWHFTQSVADELSLPRVVLRTSGLSCYLVYEALPILSQKGYFKSTVIKEEPIPELAPVTNMDIVKMLKGDFEESKLELISSMVKSTNEASGIIWNTFKELEQPASLALSQDSPTPSFYIGPLHRYFPALSSSLLEQDRSFLPWLDLQPVNSVVYVSFGSVLQIGEAEFVNMAWGLADSKQRFLWVVRPGSVSGSQWLESLPDGFMEEVGERGCIVKWAPQQEVLAHDAIGGFWTHNGWNSTLESICEGVPMICSPCSYDQPINARYVTDVWRIGVMVEKKMEREEIGRAIKRVIVEEDGSEMRERGKYLQEKVNHSLKKGGSAAQSLENLVDHILSF